MGFSIETSVPILTVFLQGLLSFFSPCEMCIRDRTYSEGLHADAEHLALHTVNDPGELLRKDLIQALL